MKKNTAFSLPSIAYYSGLNGLEIKRIIHGMDDYILCVSGCWYGGEKAKKAHCVKVEYTKTGKAFFRVYGYRIPLDECIRM